MLDLSKKGFYFPSEWQKHDATWLTFPINTDTWENRFDKIFPAYFNLIKTIAESEEVRINANDSKTISLINEKLQFFEIPSNNIKLFQHKSNDSWCRDHGPAFLLNKTNNEKIIIDWNYNAWGGKYPPYDDDNNIPKKIGEALGLKVVSPGIVMEGGSVEFNGAGTLLTSRSCLLNPNRNPHLNQQQIEKYLRDYYCVEQVLWVNDGIVGDDTDGHIDDTIRFVSENTVLCMIEPNNKDANHKILKDNLQELKRMRLINGKQLNIIEVEMPNPVFDSGERLPASYANFCITNGHVIVPTYNCNKDQKAIDIIQNCFKDRKVVGIDSTEIIWGLGSFHCLTQQEPSLVSKTE